MSDQSDQETSTWQHNTHNRQTSVAPAGFEPAIPASERPETRALDRAATGIGSMQLLVDSIDSKKNIYLMDSQPTEMVNETAKFYCFCR